VQALKNGGVEFVPGSATSGLECVGRRSPERDSPTSEHEGALGGGETAFLAAGKDLGGFFQGAGWGAKRAPLLHGPFVFHIFATPGGGGNFSGQGNFL